MKKSDRMFVNSCTCKMYKANDLMSHSAMCSSKSALGATGRRLTHT
jgi:hypothetical protein